MAPATQPATDPVSQLISAILPFGVATIVLQALHFVIAHRTLLASAVRRVSIGTPPAPPRDYPSNGGNGNGAVGLHVVGILQSTINAGFDRVCRAVQDNSCKFVPCDHCPNKGESE